MISIRVARTREQSLPSADDDSDVFGRDMPGSKEVVA